MEFTWGVAEATSDEVARFDGGTVLRSPSMPDAWSANALRYERADPGLTLDAVIATGAELTSTPYLHVNVEDEATALRLLGEAETAGWKTEREVIMRLASAPDAPDAAVREGTLEEMRALMRRWLTEEGQTPAAIEDLLKRIEREHSVRPEHLVVADHAGEVAAMATTRFSEDLGLANVEDVYASPAARGTGLGRAVTAAAARHAAERGSEVIFIVADDRDWPKELYAKVGFAPLGRRAQLHRPPASS